MLLHQLNMKNCKPVLTSMGVNARMYQSLLGKLLYLTHIWPDNYFSVSYLSRFMNCSSITHFFAAKRVVRYLAGTKEIGLWFTRGDDGILEAFSDSDWRDSLPDWKSITGMLIRLGLSAISWCARKQEIVALSTTEAEYIATTSTTCQVVWFRRLL